MDVKEIRGVQRQNLLFVFGVALCLVCRTVAAQPARPDPAKKMEALKHLRAGLAKYNEGEYQEAIKEYKKAYELYPSPKLFPNIASAYKYMGQNLNALEYFEKFLNATRDDAADPKIQRLRKDVNREVKFLLRMVGRLQLTVTVAEAVVKVAGLDRGKSPMERMFRFNPGPVNIIVKKKGFYNYDRTVNLKPGKVTTVKVVLLRKIKPKVVVKVKRATPVYKRWWFWTVVGSLVAGGATAAGIYFGSRTEEKTLTGDMRINHNTLGIRF